MPKYVKLVIICLSMLKCHRRKLNVLYIFTWLKTNNTIYKSCFWINFVVLQPKRNLVLFWFQSLKSRRLELSRPDEVHHSNGNTVKDEKNLTFCSDNVENRQRQTRTLKGQNRKLQILKPQGDLLPYLRPKTLNNPWSIFNFSPYHSNITFTRFSTTDQKKIFFCFLPR